jgi:hypothetical protein
MFSSIVNVSKLCCSAEQASIYSAASIHTTCINFSRREVGPKYGMFSYLIIQLYTDNVSGLCSGVGHAKCLQSG